MPMTTMTTTISTSVKPAVAFRRVLFRRALVSLGQTSAVKSYCR
jgi:hypothetical protein